MNRGPQSIPPEVLRQIQAAQAAQARRGVAPMSPMMPPGMAQQAPQPLPPREHTNPLPEGDDGLKTLRAYSDCPIPEEANKVNQLIQKGITVSALSEETEDALGKSVIHILRATRYCADNLRTRTVCIFAEDDELKKLSDEIKETEQKMEAMHLEMQSMAQHGEELVQRRWHTAVKTYGLSPEKYSYRVNDEKGIIEQADLDCARCKGPTVLRKTRQNLTDALMRVEIKGANNDSHGESGPAETAGQPKDDAQQEVHSVPADGTPAVGDGNSGPQVAT